MGSNPPEKLIFFATFPEEQLNEINHIIQLHLQNVHLQTESISTACCVFLIRTFLSDLEYFAYLCKKKR
jgi:hypothetical protein